MNILRRLTLLPVLGYLAYLPLGPYPLKVGDVYLDHCFAFAALILSMPFLPLVMPGSLRPILLSVAGFLVLGTISSAFAQSWEVSGRAIAVYCGYSALALTIPLAYHRSFHGLRTFLFCSATVVALVVLSLHYGSESGRQMRFSFGTVPDPESVNISGLGDGAYVDPNMTAIGLLLSLIIYFPNLLDGGKRRFWRILYEIIAASVIFSACLIFISRTALTAFFSALGLAIIVNARENINALLRIASRKTILTFVCGTLAFVLVVWWQWDMVSLVLSRLGINPERGLDTDLENIDSARVGLIKEAFTLWAQDARTILFGIGFFVTNPHNEYLRMLTDCGLLGLTAFVTLLTTFYIRICRISEFGIKYLFCQTTLFSYITVAMLFYGHTKTLWVSLMFLTGYWMETREKIFRDN